MASGGDGDQPGINPTLRQRVLDEIAIFKDALDAAVANPTDAALDELRAAADKLMRALGRVIIEIERQRGPQQSNP